DVVVVVKIVLPVVAHAEAEREAGAQLPVVLDVRADLLLEQREVAVALLLDERIGTAGGVRIETGEVERAADIGPIVEPAPAPIRKLKARLDQVMPGGPCQALVEVHVSFGAQEIALCSA